MLVSIRERHSGLEVHAPDSERVFGMAVATPSEIVRPGEAMLEIVPEDTGLVIEVRIQPTIIDQVHLGQKAWPRFSAFLAQTTPEFEGAVRRISADALWDPESGILWYEVKLKVLGPARENLMGDRSANSELILILGMPVVLYIE